MIAMLVFLCITVRYASDKWQFIETEISEFLDIRDLTLGYLDQYAVEKGNHIHKYYFDEANMTIYVDIYSANGSVKREVHKGPEAFISILDSLMNDKKNGSKFSKHHVGRTVVNNPPKTYNSEPQNNFQENINPPGNIRYNDASVVTKTQRGKTSQPAVKSKSKKEEESYKPGQRGFGSYLFRDGNVIEEEDENAFLDEENEDVFKNNPAVKKQAKPNSYALRKIPGTSSEQTKSVKFKSYK